MQLFSRIVFALWFIAGTALAGNLTGDALAAKVEAAYKTASFDDLLKVIAWRLDPTIPSSKESWETTTKNQINAAKGKINHARFYTLESIKKTKFSNSPSPKIADPIIGYVIVTTGPDESSWFPWPVIQTLDGARLVAAPWK